MPLTISIHSNIRDYIAVIEEEPSFIERLAANDHAIFVIDENVWNLYAKTLLKPLLPDRTIILPISENRKNLSIVQELYDQLVEQPAKRNLTLVSFGGGILQDITGFVASTLYRGINWIYVPTTLLAQADSCIGSKTSLNYGNYKNLIGTFFPPTCIHIYTPFLKTQLDSDFLSGFGEIIKLHLMGGHSQYLKLVEKTPAILKCQPEALFQAIHQSLQIKLSYMDGDEFDMGRRNLLNYGHDFGHALESTSNFSIPHGQAVVFGMLAANIVAKQRGILHENIELEIANNLLLPNLTTRPTPDVISADLIINAMKKDKKRVGDQLALIMMNSNFAFTRINDLAPEEVFDALSAAKKRLF